jgi:hypothetical protein
MTVHMNHVQDWWERAEFRSPHSPEAVASREANDAERRRHMAAHGKPKTYEQRVRERFASNRK